MMGRRQRIEGKLFYTDLRLDSRVRPDNPLRQIRATIDFDFARAVVQPLYGTVGNPSVDPAVLMKLMLLSVLENIPSERELMERMPERIDWMWFCEYDWDDPIPNHSVISKARRRWGVEVFSQLFQRVLAQCMDAGLVDGRTLHVDASIIRAHADQSTLHPLLRVAGQELYARLDAADGPVPADDPPRDPPPGTWVSPTDPDARLTRKNGQPTLGYKDHRVVDDACGIITATVTTDAATAEAHVIEEALDQHEHHAGRSPRTVVADKGYGTAQVYESMAQRQITPCIPHQKHTGGHGVGIYPAGDFFYDAGRDAYRCPHGQWLERYATTADGTRRYRAGPGVCRGCPRRAACTRARDGRRLTRCVGQEWIDWADRCCSQAHRRRMGRRRMYRAEGSFADAANHHGYKRARWRGLVGMTIQNLLIASAQNIRKLIRWRRRKPAAALRGGRNRLAQVCLHLVHLLRQTVPWPSNRRLLPTGQTEEAVFCTFGFILAPNA